MAVAIKISVCLEVAQTGHSSTMNINIVDGDVLTATCAAKNVIISAFVRRRTSDVSDYNIRDADTSSWVAGWATIEIILLNVNTVDGDILNADILEQDIVDEAGGVLVSLDAGAILSD